MFLAPSLRMAGICIISIAAAGASGCATSYAERMADAPAVEFVSGKSVDEYVGCAAPAAMDVFAGMVSVIPDGSSKVIAVAISGTNDVIATVTVSPRDTGSGVAIREAFSGGKFKGLREAMTSCK